MMLEKIQIFHNLKKFKNFKKNLKMLKFFGQVQENHIIFLQAKKLGCHIITVPPSIIEKIEKFGKIFLKSYY